jgi:hypothetical protein
MDQEFVLFNLVTIALPAFERTARFGGIHTDAMLFGLRPSRPRRRIVQPTPLARRCEHAFRDLAQGRAEFGYV